MENMATKLKVANTHPNICIYEHMTRKLKNSQYTSKYTCRSRADLREGRCIERKRRGKDRTEELTQGGAARSTERLNAGRQRLSSQRV
jgi:hypothetical protein